MTTLSAMTDYFKYYINVDDIAWTTKNSRIFLVS
jgi:hypothetical protein